MHNIRCQTCVFRRSTWVSWPVHCVAFALQQECGTELLCWLYHGIAVQSVMLFTPQHSNWKCKSKEGRGENKENENPSCIYCVCHFKCNQK